MDGDQIRNAVILHADAPQSIIINILVCLRPLGDTRRDFLHRLAFEDIAYNGHIWQYLKKVLVTVIHDYFNKIHKNILSALVTSGAGV